jgi:hypothetical protein
MNEVTAGGKFRCEGCGKTFPWKAHLAGRKVRCPCGQVMECPQSPPEIDEAAANPQSQDDVYDFVPYVSKAKKAEANDGTGSANPPPAPVLEYRSAPTEASKSDPANFDPDKFKRLTAPLWILTGAIIVEAGITAWRFRTNPGKAEIQLFVGVGVGTLLIMIGVFIVAYFRQIEIGSFGTALLRLAAIAVAPSAVSDILSPLGFFIPLFALILLGVRFVLYFALDQDDTWSCVILIFVISILVYMGIIVFLPRA